MFRNAVPSILTTRFRLLSCCNVVNSTQTQIKSCTYHQTLNMKVNPSFLLTIPFLTASDLFRSLSRVAAMESSTISTSTFSSLKGRIATKSTFS